MGKAHSIKECKVNLCLIDRYDRKHNQLLHENRSGRRPIHQESTKSSNQPSQPTISTLSQNFEKADWNKTLFIFDFR